MGWDWPFSPYWFALLASLLLFLLLLHSRAVLRSTLPQLAWKLIFLRVLGLFIFLILIARPFVSTEEPNPKEFHLLSFTDLSGSMNTKDIDQQTSRADRVKPFVDSTIPDSWINQMRTNYGKVDNLGFSNQVNRLGGDSWGIIEMGQKTAIGDALSEGLEDERNRESLGAVVVFSDGRNNEGAPVLEVAKEYRARGIPVNVVGVGKERAIGDLSIKFSERKPKAIAKEELLLSALVENKFEYDTKANLTLMLGDSTLEEIKVSMAAGETREVNFSPIVPKQAGPQRYRILINSPRGDVDPSNNSDSLLVVVKPPDQFTTLYISNQIRPLFPFVKRILVDEERFDFRALIRMSEKAFYAFGDELKPQYPENPSFWMEYDAIVMDTKVLGDLNQSLVLSLKDFVQKKGEVYFFSVKLRMLVQSLEAWFQSKKWKEYWRKKTFLY